MTIPYKHVDDRTEDPSLLWAEIHHLRAALQGPEGYDTWQDAAVAERMLRVTEGRAKTQLPVEPPSFQYRVQPWMMACFGMEISADKLERNHRFLEEALELVQAGGLTQDEAHQLVDYVYGRPVGEPSQEVGGVMVTLAALCLARGLNMHVAAETELARIWTKIDVIRAKQAAKPKHSPLPETSHGFNSGDLIAAMFRDGAGS